MLRVEDANRKLQALASLLIRVVSSRKFFVAILLIAALQGIWYALSFKPIIYDEARHFNNIAIYAQQFSPFFKSQNIEWDVLGQVIRDGSYLYYYVMSWPLRLVSLFTESQTYQIIALRLLSIGFFVSSLVFLRRALTSIKSVPQYITNLSLLFFVLTPAAGLLAGTINYDGLAFLLFSITLWLSLKFINSDSFRADLLTWTIISGIFMSLMKWSYLALLVPVAGYLLYFAWREYGRSIVAEFIKSFSSLRNSLKIVLIGLLLIGGILLVERPVANYIIYGKPSPGCAEVIGDNRCQSFRDYVIYSELQKNRSDDFRPVSPVQFTIQHWLPRMSSTMTNLLEQGRSTELPVTSVLYDYLIVASAVVIILGLRELLGKNRAYGFMLIVALAYVSLLIAKEYGGYVKNGGPVAIRARYLVPVLPVFMYFTATSARLVFNRYKKLMLAMLLGLLLVLTTQGGGIVTYLLTTPESAYWNYQVTSTFNNNLKNVVEPVVIE